MKWTKTFIIVVLFSISIIFTKMAFAAPFCAVYSYGTNCWYYSYEACIQAVGTNGACIINQDEVQAPSGGAPFCVVTSHGTNCWYYSAESCREAAASSGGVCAVNSNR